MSIRGLLVASIGCIGCGGGSDKPPGDAPPVEAFAKLLEGDWSLPSGGEGYFCVYATLPADVDIKAFRPLAPNGTHHTVLTKYVGTTPADGVYPCNVSTNGMTMVYGSGVGAPDFSFPAGIGLHMVKGTRLLLNLHLYNATDQPLNGRSGVSYLPATAGELQHFAELVLAGPTIGLSIPQGQSTQSGTCQISRISSQPIQVFALSQHMHKLGTHMKSTVTRSGSPDIVLQDIPYDFESQSFHHTEALVELRSGDTLTTYCTYNNTTPAAVGFGESSDDEMCFTDLFYYPAQQAELICTL